MHLFVIPFWITVTFICAVAVFAFWIGDWRARAIASIEVIELAVGQVVCNTWPCWGTTVPPLVAARGFFEDSALLAVCLACAWRADRYWVLWASSFALLNLATDSVWALNPHVTRWAFMSASLVWTYLMEASVLIGVWSSARTPGRAPQSPAPAGRS